MKGKIDKNGNLCILRGRSYIKTDCRIGGTNSDAAESNAYCKHTCSLFGEPDTAEGPAPVVLDLCKRTLYFEDLIDEREPVDTPEK